MFAVSNQPSTYKFTAPLEQHGQEAKSSTSLRFKLNLHSAILAAFHAGLREVLYRKAEAGEQPELPVEHPDGLTKLALPKLAALQIDDVLPGYGLGMTCGLDASDVQHFADVKLSNFRLEPLNGGTVEVQVSAHFHPTPDQVAWIYAQQGREVEVSLLPPAGAPAVEASPQASLALETGTREVLVTRALARSNRSTHLWDVVVDLAGGGSEEFLQLWAYCPTLDEIAIALHDRLGASVEFDSVARGEYERAAA